jgi:hypothetical protein
MSRWTVVLFRGDEKVRDPRFVCAHVHWVARKIVLTVLGLPTPPLRIQPFQDEVVRKYIILLFYVIKFLWLYMVLKFSQIKGPELFGVSSYGLF